MKTARLVVAHPVRVQFNTTDASKHQWARIINSQGDVLHTGQPKYIKGLAKKKFNIGVIF